MKSVRILATLLACSFPLCATADPAQHADTETTPPAQATVPSSRTYTYVSAFNHERYGVDIFIPRGTPPPGGYPALYLLDGNVLFATFADAMHNKSNAGEVEPAVIVGIRSTDTPDGGDRTYDFTYSDMSPREKSIVVDLGDNPRFGGYNDFFRAIEEEIRPAVGRIVPLDPNRAVLLGWSLGGLFVTHTMFVHPEAFHGYVALSPALWRNERAVFSEIPQFEQSVTSSGRRLSLFLGVGSLEEQISPGMRKWKIDQTKLAAEMEHGRMVGNARDMAKELGPFFQQKQLRFTFRLFDGETHNSAPWSAVNPVLDFEFPLNADSER
ncbi:alpha/beta hydrolase [Silvibacterium sp.]|uniref:alpha/beta hydrolase n=1 Tax=Silvibacterium sp. TaxID=1964179 RepID=UPI0039E32C64